jgi:release factor glutamine methyltransferase
VPGSSSPSPRPEVVARLRAAGCVFAEDEADLIVAAARDQAELARLVGQRAAGMPLEQVLGWAEFCGQRIAVEPGVFAPRRRTEFLAAQAIALARRNPAASPPVLVDLCCGSGAVAAAVAAALPLAGLYAVDIDPAAVRCARRNLAAVGGQVYQGDLYQPLPGTLRSRVDVLIANAPYVPTAEIGLLPAEARSYEPRTALDGGEGGLAILRRVAAAAPRWLAAGGHLLVETSERQAAQMAGIAAGHGLVPQVVSSAELAATVIIGRRAGR